MWPTHWPQLAREIAEHTRVALAAARTRSVPAWEDATTELVALPYEQVAGVHATMMRELLEELHPDGLAGEDVQAVFERSARTGAAWLPSLHPDTVVAVHIHPGDVAESCDAQDCAPPIDLEFADEGLRGCARAGRQLLSSLVDEPGQFYLHVHTARFPKGAVRGQLEKR